jgi:hypothetical protein
VGAPADAIREFTQTLADVPVVAVASHVRDDLFELRRAFASDDDFAAALRAVARRLRTLHVAGGEELDHDLAGWLRIKFSSTVVDRADLRIIFRKTSDGIELRAFGHRHDPESVYFRAARRS